MAGYVVSLSIIKNGIMKERNSSGYFKPIMCNVAQITLLKVLSEEQLRTVSASTCAFGADIEVDVHGEK